MMETEGSRVVRSYLWGWHGVGAQGSPGQGGTRTSQQIPEISPWWSPKEGACSIPVSCPAAPKVVPFLPCLSPASHSSHWDSDPHPVLQTSPLSSLEPLLRNWLPGLPGPTALPSCLSCLQVTGASMLCVCREDYLLRPKLGVGHRAPTS